MAYKFAYFIKHIYISLITKLSNLKKYQFQFGECSTYFSP